MTIAGGLLQGLGGGLRELYAALREADAQKRAEKERGYERDYRSNRDYVRDAQVEAAGERDAKQEMARLGLDQERLRQQAYMGQKAARRDERRVAADEEQSRALAALRAAQADAAGRRGRGTGTGTRTIDQYSEAELTTLMGALRESDDPADLELLGRVRGEMQRRLPAAPPAAPTPANPGASSVIDRATAPSLGNTVSRYIGQQGGVTVRPAPSMSPHEQPAAQAVGKTPAEWVAEVRADPAFQGRTPQEIAAEARRRAGQ